ncbi:hypothetical protein [Marinomonas epiphytica]
MQPDIEIYVLSCPTETIVEWLNTDFTVINKQNVTSDSVKLTLSHQGQEINVTILEKAAGKRFTSIWFDSDKTPWSTDMECAQQAFTALEHEVRCNYQGWEEEGDQDPDQWWRVNKDGSGPFIWK